jgi:hypothetical protein
MTFQDKVISVDPLATLASAMVEAGGSISSGLDLCTSGRGTAATHDARCIVIYGACR